MKSMTTMRLMLVGVLVYATGVAAMTPASTHTIELKQGVHFLTPSGDDVLIEAGAYEVESIEGWLRLTPEKGTTRDAELIEAMATTHEEALSSSLVWSLEGKDMPGPLNDYHIVGLLFPGGKGLEAVGTYTGVRSRFGFTNSRILYLSQQLAIAKNQLNQINQEISRLESKLSTVGDDAQLANIDLQNLLQKQQQTLQTISNISKMLHDTSMAIIRKIG